MKKRNLDFRKDRRTSGIPRNYFLCDGEVNNISDILNGNKPALLSSSLKIKKTTSFSSTPPVTTGTSTPTTGNETKQTLTDKKLKLCDSPDRAAALLFLKQTNAPRPDPLQPRPRNQKTGQNLNAQLKEYHKFIVEGPRCTDGSFVTTLQSQSIHRRQLLFPSQNADELVRHLQR
jgi:hypothetical protein